MLVYASKLTEAPGMIGKDDIRELTDNGWSDREVWEITALTAFFNFSGRLEAASGLPPDKIPAGADFAEGRAGARVS